MVVKKEMLDIFWKVIDSHKGNEKQKIRAATEEAGMSDPTGRKYFSLGRDYDPNGYKKQFESKKVLIKKENDEKYLGFISSPRRIDNIIDKCSKDHDLKVNKSRRTYYTEFLESLDDLKLLRGKKAKEHPKLFFNYFVDSLLLFSYLTGKTPIIAGHKALGEYKEDIQEKTINSVLDLYLLRRVEVGCVAVSASQTRLYDKNKANKTDLRIIKLYNRIESRQRKFGLPGLKITIDELGKNKLVYNHLTRNKKYVKEFEKQTGIKLPGYINMKIINACSSPNPFTSNHGGIRIGSGQKKIRFKKADYGKKVHRLRTY